MAHWAEFEAAEADLAASVKSILTSRKHHTLATLRKDGSPRVSGLEVAFNDDDVVGGIMPGSLKLTDVRRDSRVAIHALSEDPPEDNQGAWKGDAKLAGRIVEQAVGPEDQPPGALFWLDITEVALTHLDSAATQLEIESWHPGRGREVKRRA
ncbi:MAG: pyridoxamine 5'-phosphate oxidase family protein [Candidatus Dormibacteria bacterium]